MFKKGLLISLFILLFGLLNGQDRIAVQSDSNTVKLDGYIDSYLSMTPPHRDSLIKACDYLISFSKDSLIQSHITQYLFDKFYSSKLMGMESVAIHIARNYYLNGKLVWPDKVGLIALKIFVDFNENSLLGMDAPELNLKDLQGNTISLRGVVSNYILVFFFDDQCSTCKKMFPLIKDIVKNHESNGVMVYAVYTESNRDNFLKFVEQEFPDIVSRKNWIFTWDPEFKSNFHKLYNVMKTPQMFLLDKRKVIIGRNLDDKALEQLLSKEIEAREKLVKNIDQFIDKYLQNFNLEDTSDLKSAFEPLYEKSVSSNNPEVYSSIFYQLFENLWRSADEPYENAAIYLAENYITPKTDLWWDKSIPTDYVPKIVNRIKSNRIGSVANDFTIFDKDNKAVRLSKVKSKYTVIYFYSPDCAICKPFSMELKKIYRSLKRSGAKVIAIDVTSNYAGYLDYKRKNNNPWPAYWIGENGQLELYYKFETQKVPMIYLLDNERRILVKKINTITLEKLVK
ncbi:MAG: redoxin domain-containing protein [Rikenellaceae bacterium]